MRRKLTFKLCSSESPDLTIEIDEKSINLHMTIIEYSVDNADEIGLNTHVWQSGILLAQYILQNQEIFKDKDVLELGSGTGIVGIAASCTGSKRVVYTDINSASILNLLKSNISLNSHLFQGDFTVKALDWKNPDSEILDQKFDIILGADCTYEENDYRNFVSCISYILNKNVNAKCFLVHEVRSLALPLVSWFNHYALLTTKFELNTQDTKKYIGFLLTTNKDTIS